MKQNTRFKKLLKKSFCITFAALLFFVYGIHDPYAVYGAITINEEQQSYKWTRVTSQTDLEEAISRIHETDFNKMDRNYNSNTYWTRAMLVWQWGDDVYFTSQGAGSEDDYWYGRAALAGYGIDISQNVFYTRTGLDTPYIKECVGGQNSSYEKEHAYCFRLCETGSERMTDYVACCELNFFGVAYHAATQGEFTLYAKVNDKWNGSYKSSASANDDRLLTTNLRFTTSWTDYFNNYGITEKQKNALMVAFEHYAYFSGYATSDTRSYGCEEVAAAFGYSTWYDFWKGMMQERDYTGASYSSKYVLKGYYSGEECVAYALEHCTDPEIYDTSVFTKIYKTDKYPEGISGGEAFDKLFRASCKSYDTRTDREEGCAYCYYDFNGNISQRLWIINGSRIEIEARAENSYGKFYLYIGEPYNTPKYSGDVKLEVGVITYFGNNTQIDNGMTVTVGAGSTLVIEKHVYNNGTIIVDGGTLIITGFLDTDPKTKIAGNPNAPTNRLIIQNGGLCTITDTGAFISRDGNSLIQVSGNSTLQVDGVIATSSLKISQYSTVRCNHGSAVLVGVKSKDSISINYFDATKLKMNDKKNSTINSIVDNCVNTNDSANKVANFIINGQSSMTSDGLVYINGTSSYGTDCAWSFWLETDSNRTINDGMKIW